MNQKLNRGIDRLYRDLSSGFNAEQLKKVDIALRAGVLYEPNPKNSKGVE